MPAFEHAPHITELLREHARTRPDQEAVSLVRDLDRADGTTTLTYQRLDAEARRIAVWLQERFAPGERVLMLYPVGVDFVAAFFGCLYAGMITVPAPLPGQYPHQRRRVRSIARDAGVRAIFTDSTHAAAVTEWAGAEGLEGVTVLATDTQGDGDPEAWRMPPTSRDTLLLLQYTSGSTGEPKGVMVSHHNLLHNVASFQRALGFTDRTRFGGWIPLYHDMGLMAQLLPALFLGSACVLMTPNAFVMRPHLWLRMIDKHDIGYSAAPNFAFELCRRRVSDAQLAGLDLSRWEFAANGSEPVQASTLRAFAQRFAAAGFRESALCPCYGMAEATVFVSGRAHRPPVVHRVVAEALEQHEYRLATEGQQARELVSCGVPEGYDVRVVDPATRATLRPGMVGELWLRGDSVSRGYWNNPRATSANFGAATAEGEEGFLRTGDLGLVLDGEVYVTGRIKEMLITHGRNLYPQDIEHEVRAQHPELATRFGAVFTVSPPDEEETVVVTHEVKGRFDTEGYRQLVARIKVTVSREFGIRVGGVALLKPGSVQRTTSGKIQRAAMRTLFLANALPVLHEELDAQVLHARQAQPQELPPSLAGAAQGAEDFPG
ncbi:fatty acyl-AMP ligase [Corallococcus exiguus]|uniref:fatty acyl-AMP ligase n=1 Tax=Corallococcus exiguus TaxID=83462 RepID=UPI001A8DD5C9|nr:fatty acyl-AMP ligase [Corallococcus exiguus]MBN8467946.1 fatty acyl-AMP ligase [Corallococcus exiguus]